MTHLAAKMRWVVGALLGVTTTGAMLEVAFALDRPGELAWYRLVSFSYLIGGVLVFIVVARAILDRDPTHPVGWLLLLFVWSPVSSLLANGYTIWELPGSALITWVMWFAGAPSLPAMAGAIMLFPTGRLPSVRWRWLGRAAGVAGVVALVVAAVAPWPYPPYPNDTYFAENPIGIEALRDAYGVVLGIGFLVLLGSVASVIVRWRRARGLERDQIRPFGVAGVLVALTAMSAIVGALSSDFDSVDSEAWNFVVGDAVFSLGIATVALAIGAGVVRYRLYGIDRLMSRTATYAALLVVVGAGFGLLAALGTTIVTGSASPVVVVVVLTAAVILAQPLRRRVEANIERRVFGGRPGSWDSLRSLVRSIGREPRSVSSGAAEAARELTGARAARAELDLPDGTTVRTVAGDPTIDRWDPAVEVRDEGVVVGRLAISAGDGRRQDVPALERVATVTGRAMSNLRLNADLDEAHARLQATNRALASSHHRLLVAADAERDRLGADVRMRLDPPLAELRAALGDWCATGVPKCEGIADAAARLVPTSVALAEEIRRLARGVFPPILSDLGLAAAVRALVRHVGSDVEVDFDEELGRRRFAADAEAVCYLCCRALVDDAVAADADRVVMHLGHAGHDLIVTGSYVARRAADPAELGVARDRVGAVGGRFELRCGSSVGIDVTVPGA